MKTPSLILSLLTLFTLTFVLTSAGPALAQPTTILVTRGFGGVPHNGDASYPDVSANGRYVVFSSDANNLLDDPLSEKRQQVYLWDRQNDEIVLISKAPDGTPGNGISFDPHISASGTAIVFVSSSSNLVAGDTNGTTDVFVAYPFRSLGEKMELVSVATDGTPGNLPSWEPSISADGLHVAFESYASTLVADDANNVQDVFVRDLVSEETVRISVDRDGQEWNESSKAPDISGDGEIVVFDSAAPLTGTANTDRSVFVYDRTNDLMVRLVPAGNSILDDKHGINAVISNDGRHVVFESSSDDWGNDDTNGYSDIFLHDRQAGTTARVSDSNSVGQGNGHSRAPEISGDSRTILFRSEATNLVNNDTNNLPDLFAYDAINATLERMNLSASGVEGDGGVGGFYAVSTSGQHVVFSSGSTNLVPNDTNLRFDIFLRDRGDVAGPKSMNLAVGPTPAVLGAPITIRATIDDTERGSSNIAAAEYQVADGDWQMMEADDGQFDQPIEDVVVHLENGLDYTGTQPICVRGRDALGNTGIPVCLDFTIESALITLTITRITNYSIQLDNLSEPDFYVKAWVAPVSLASDQPTFDNEADHTQDTANVEPFWTFSNTLDEFSNNIVALEVWDHDPTSPNDMADINPDPNKEGIALSIDMTTGKWSGDVAWPQSCTRGDSDAAVEICWAISTLSETDDTDGDGLLDDWERNGLDQDGDGTIDVDLPAMGADPFHKDIFVEIDYMIDDAPGGISYRPMPKAIDQVVQAFDNAPVINPNGEAGIHLHVDYGPDAPLTWGAAERWDNLSGSNGLPYQANLGTCDANDRYNWTEFDALESLHFVDERLPVFHYNIWVDAICPEKPNTAGIARMSNDEVMEGSAFIVSMGIMATPNGTQREQAGIFMHELGHNLGLRHGGADDINYKPNYLSIMNYFFTTQGLVVDREVNILDYSRYSLPPLDENGLDETVGISAPAGLILGTRWWCDGRKQFHLGWDSFPVDKLEPEIDWNCSRDIDTSSISANINGEQGSLLESQNDWDNIVFKGGAVGGLGTVYFPPEVTILDEITREDIEAVPPWPEIDSQPKVYLPLVVQP